MSRIAIVSGPDPAEPSPPASPAEQRRAWAVPLANAGWLVTSRLGGDAMSFALVLVLSREFGPAGLGQYSYGFAVGGFAQALVQLGLEDYGVRECARLPVEAQRALLSRLLTIQLAMAAVACVSVVGFLLLTAPLPDTAAVVLLFTAVQLAYVLAGTLFVPAYARQRMAGPATLDVACRAIGLCLSIVLVVGFHAPLVMSLLPLPVAYLVLAVLAARSASRYLGRLDLSVNLREWVKIGRATWPFAAAFIVFQVNARVDVLGLSLLKGEEVTGIYSAAGKLLESGSMPLFYLGLAAYPGLSQLANKSDRRLAEAASRFVAQCLLAGALLAWALFYFAPLVVVPVLGARFGASTATVKMLAPLGLLAAYEVVGMRLLLASHLQVRRLQLQFISAVVKTLLVVTLIPPFGIVGAVIASVSALLLLDGLYIVALRDHPLHAAYRQALKQMGVCLVLTSVVGALAFAWSAYDWVSGIATLAAIVLAGVATGLLPIRMKRYRLAWRT